MKYLIVVFTVGKLLRPLFAILNSVFFMTVLGRNTSLVLLLGTVVLLDLYMSQASHANAVTYCTSLRLTGQ